MAFLSIYATKDPIAMKTAMILAAGRGERLKPLTNSIPKAMCLINGIPLIEYHVRNLAKAGFTRVVINHAHLGFKIRHHLGDGKNWGIDIAYAPEPPGGLETGGGIFNALPLLGNEPFLTVNADIYTDFKLNTIKLPANFLAHLLLGKNPKHNIKGDFGLKNNLSLTNNQLDYTYLGIAVYHPEAFKQYSPGRYSVIPMVRTLINENRASGELFQGLWIDIGTAERLRHANQIKF
jgi:N-acetyl-alpha-D-muramate 1-phosphate uridylyltransferase